MFLISVNILCLLISVYILCLLIWIREKCQPGKFETCTMSLLLDYSWEAYLLDRYEIQGIIRIHSLIIKTNIIRSSINHESNLYFKIHDFISFYLLLNDRHSYKIEYILFQLSIFIHDQKPKAIR